MLDDAEKRTFPRMIEQRAYPPLHIDAGVESLEAIGAGITSLAPILNRYQPDEAGPRADLVWIKDIAGGVWAVGVNQLDLEFKFEVFSLTIESETALKARVETGRPFPLPDDAPDWLRAAAAAPRVAPVPPADFQRPPFKVSRMHVLRRAEFTMSNVDVGPTFGENPNAQTAAMPHHVPAEADAYCIVSVGLLLIGAEGERLLVGVDWFPFNLIMTTHPGVIDDYTASCEMIDIHDYAQRLRSAGQAV